LTVVVTLCAVVSMLASWSASASAASPSPPSIDEQWVENVSDSTATVNAKINPIEYATVYYVEYGLDTSYGSRAPVSPVAIGSGSEDVAVGQNIAGLEGGAIYHYRFVATNANGTTDGPDKTFRPSPTPAAVADSCPNAQIRGLQAAQHLSDCRAYEMVSPPDKDGGDIPAAQTNITAAVDGSAVQYVSVTGFAGAYGLNAFGGGYIAERSTGEGWVTHAITPSQNPPVFPIARVAMYAGDFSPDLNTGVYLSISPFEAIEPNVANVPNLYLRTDLLKAGHGTYQLLSGCPECEKPLPARPFFVFGETDPALAGASEDFSHVIFESTGDLTRNTFGLGEQPKLYESVNGVVRLAGILPGGAVAQGSVAGQGAISPNSQGVGYARESMYTPHTISAKGSRIVFTAGPLLKGGETGLANEHNYEAYAGNLYLRENGTTSVKLNASERSTPEPEQPALYMNASKDDSKIFFVTNEALNDETTHPGQNLYMYDVNAPEHHHLTLIAAQQGDVGLWVPGVSDDGSYVYFATKYHADPYNRNYALYVWHEGTARLVAEGGAEPHWGEESYESLGAGGALFRVTPDGKHVVFASRNRGTAEGVGYDNCLAAQRSCSEISSETEFSNELYLYDYETNKLTCVSCDPSGERPVGGASFMKNSDDVTTVGLSKTQHLNNALTEEGSKVFFDTPDPLVRQDTNGKRDVYEYDARTGKLSLISSGRSSNDSLFVEATPDGSNVFFTTSEQLVKAEIDGNFDLYDAREKGGIPSQNVGPSATCESDDCQGPAKAAPVFSLPSSLTFQGQGNPAAGQIVSGRAKSPTRAARLKRALRTCRRMHGRQRRACERNVRKRFRAVKSSAQAAAVAARGR
jgi:Tol biopolymer transport system component